MTLPGHGDLPPHLRRPARAGQSTSSRSPLLDKYDGLTMVPLEAENACCGFGGTFAVKYPDISTAIVTDKTRQIAGDQGADTLLAGDLGCLMNMAGKLSREGRGDIRVFHPAEILAGMADGPGNGGSGTAKKVKK